MPEEAKGTCDLEAQPETFVFQAEVQIETDFVVMTNYSVIPVQRPGRMSQVPRQETRLMDLALTGLPTQPRFGRERPCCWSLVPVPPTTSHTKMT